MMNSDHDDDLTTARARIEATTRYPTADTLRQPEPPQERRGTHPSIERACVVCGAQTGGFAALDGARIVAACERHSEAEIADAEPIDGWWRE